MTFDIIFGSGAVVVGQNIKCPYRSADRLFRTENNNPLTRAECEQKCYDTPGCHFFTLGVCPSQNEFKGLCMVSIVL